MQGLSTKKKKKYFAVYKTIRNKIKETELDIQS